MTVKEIAQQTGLTHQAVYKRLKAAGIAVAELKDSKTGRFTESGEQIVRELFNLDNNQDVNPASTDDNQVAEVARLNNQVEELTKEREELRNQVETLSKEADQHKHEVELLNQQVEALTSERDYLRDALDKSQQLQMATLASVKLLPSGEKKRRSLWDVLRGRGGKDAEQEQ